VSWALPVTTEVVPLLAEALAVISTLPTAPVAHCTLMVPVPVETMVAIVWPEGLSTTNDPL